jgi:type II secretory pathway component PulF
LFKKHTYKRKYKFIDKRQQVRFAVDVALHSLLFPIFFLILTILPPFSTMLMGESSDDVKPILLDFFRIAIDHWWILAIALGFVAYFSVLFSHRIFGPIRRFENLLLKKRDDPSSIVRCNLRTADYFQDFSHLFEQVLNRELAEGSSQEVVAASQEEAASEEAASEEVAEETSESN